MSNDIPALDEGVPSSLDLGENNLVPNLPDSKVDEMFASLAVEAEVPTPDPTTEVKDDLIEESEENELTDSDDETPLIETSDDEVTTAEADQDTPDSTELSIVEYDEAKNFKFPIKNSDTGEVEYKTIDQINAEVNKSRKQDAAHNEVETANQEIEQKRESLREYENRVQATQANAAGMQQLAKYDNAMNQVQEAISAAAADGNGERVALLQVRANELANGRQQVIHNVTHTQQQLSAEAARRMSEFGMGDLNTDKQRQKLFKDYAQETIPAGLMGVVGTSPELMVLLEKARMFDKGQSVAVKGKLKGNKSGIKGGAAKAAPKAAPKKSTLQSKLDNMFK